MRRQALSTLFSLGAALAAAAATTALAGCTGQVPDDPAAASLAPAVARACAWPPASTRAAGAGRSLRTKYRVTRGALVPTVCPQVSQP